MLKFLKTRKLKRNSIFIKILSIYVPRLKTQRKIYLSHYLKFWTEFLTIIVSFVLIAFLFPIFTLVITTIILSPIVALWLAIKFVEIFDINNIHDFHITLTDK